MKPYFRFLPEDGSTPVEQTKKINKEADSKNRSAGKTTVRRRREITFSNQSGPSKATVQAVVSLLIIVISRTQEIKKFCSLSHVCQDLAYSSYKFILHPVVKGPSYKD